MEDILDLQYMIAYNNAKKLINNLKEAQALYIINKDMNARVLFYYKENTYFISDEIKLNKDYIYLANSKELEDICYYISKNFDDTDRLRLSILVNNIDNLINDYMIDSLILVVDRINRNILQSKSLEFYNDLIVINMDGISRIFKQDDKIICDEINVLGENKSYKVDNVLKNIYRKNNIYPHDYIFEDECFEFEPDDIIPINNISPMILFPNISCEQLISFGFITLEKDINYIDDDIFDLVNGMIKVINTSDTIKEDIQALMLDLYHYYDTPSKYLN